jgi:hypothetical protein
LIASQACEPLESARDRCRGAERRIFGEIIASPGPKGGIQGEKDPTACNPAGTDTCNFGTPMMGVITVLPRHHDENVTALPPR